MPDRGQLTIIFDITPLLSLESNKNIMSSQLPGTSSQKYSTTTMYDNRLCNKIESTKRPLSMSRWNIFALADALNCRCRLRRVTTMEKEKQSVEERNVLFIIYELWLTREWSAVAAAAGKPVGVEKLLSLPWRARERTIRVIQNNYYTLWPHYTHAVSVWERQWTCWSSLSRPSYIFYVCMLCARRGHKKFAALPAALHAHNILVIISACRLVNILTSPATRCALQAAYASDGERKNISRAVWNN